MTKISVIIPVYNAENYLKKCIESVFNQTLKDIEIVCVDDKSTDSSLKILKEFAQKDKRIKIIELAQNGGVSKARNAGIENAKGDYLAFLDSDDFFAPDFLEKLYNKANFGDCDAVKGNIYNYNPETEESYLSDFYNMNDKIRENKSYFYYGFTSAIYKKDFITENKIFFPDGINYFEDPYFSICANINYKKMDFDDSAIYYYTQNKDLSDEKMHTQDNLESISKCAKMCIKKMNIACLDKISYFINFNFLKNFLYAWLKQDDMIGNAVRYLIEIIDLCPYINKQELFEELRGSNDKIKKIYNIELVKYLQKNPQKTPKISVTIPVYNAEKYLERCLNSVINQSFKDLEIICVNDCSKDNSKELLKEFAKKDSRIKGFTLSQNKGESIARNEGIEEATGDYIAFLDNDDELDLDFYEKLYNRAIETKADIIKAGVKNYHYDGKVEVSPVNSEIKRYNSKYYFTYEWWSAIYKRDLIMKNNIRLPEGLPLGGDITFLNRAITCSNNLALVEGTYYNYLMREDSGNSKVLPEVKVKSAIQNYEYMITNTNMSKIYDFIGYNHIFEFVFDGAYDLSLRSETEEGKDAALNALFMIHEHCKTQEILEQYIKAKYPDILKPIKDKDFDGLKKSFEVKIPTQRDLAFAMLRQKMKEKSAGNFVFDENSAIPVFICGDNNYAKFVATTMASVLYNTISKIDFYILDGGITEENQRRIEKLRDKFDNFNSIEYLKIDPDKYFKDFKLPDNLVIALATYNKFFIFSQKNKLKRAVYLDSDAIVLGDIKELYCQDLKGKPLGAVSDVIPDYYVKQVKRDIGMNENSIYFNAGVMLVDLERCEDNVTEKLFKIEQERREKLYMCDQDVLNIYFENNYTLLDDKYDVLYENKFTFVRHFIGKIKPWHANFRIHGQLPVRIHCIEDFWKYARMTDFINEIKAEETKFINSKVIYQLYNRLIKKEMINTDFDQIKQKELCVN